MNNSNGTQSQAQQESPAFELDSDEPLPVCPMRKDGPGEVEICEACQ